jgi:hypothetical protein
MTDTQKQANKKRKQYNNIVQYRNVAENETEVRVE